MVDMARSATTTDAFNAVAEASRRELLDAIGDGEVTVGELVDRLGLSQPQVSKHLGVLRAVGLVLVRADGRRRWYRVNGAALKPVHDWARSFERTWNTRLDRLDDLLAELQSSDRRPPTTGPPTTRNGAPPMNTSTHNRHGSAAVTLPSDTEILITRQFDAPSALVFKAITTPELVKRWWGFDTSVWKVCDIDLRVGGSWRYVVGEGDEEVGFHGVYREIDAPRRIVSTEAFEGLVAMGITDDPDSVASVNTVTLEEVDGVTTMSTLVQHVTKEHRDGHINSGMEGGMQVSFDRLEDLVTRAAD